MKISGWKLDDEFYLYMKATCLNVVCSYDTEPA